MAKQFCRFMCRLLRIRIIPRSKANILFYIPAAIRDYASRFLESRYYQKKKKKNRNKKIVSCPSSLIREILLNSLANSAAVLLLLTKGTK